LLQVDAPALGLFGACAAEVLGVPEPTGPGAVEAVVQHGCRVREAPDDWVETLARVDDLTLGAVRESWWRRRCEAGGQPGSMPGDLAEALRGVVVQCRAARLNRWQVLIVDLGASRGPG
jgi:hypothetical protein